MQTRFFQTRSSFVRTLHNADSERFTQTTLQAQASDAVARREYLARYSVTTNTQQENN